MSADFFEPGQTYVIDDGITRPPALCCTFRAEFTALVPGTGMKVAFGFMRGRTAAEWHPHFETGASWSSGWRLAKDGEAS
jgi:hypothetical protein